VRAGLGTAIVFATCLGLAAGCTGTVPGGEAAAAPVTAAPVTTAPATSPPGAADVGGRPGATGTPTRPAAITRAPAGAAVVAETSAAAMALRVSSEWWVQAPVVVVAAADDPAAQLRAASVAVMVGAPVLLAGADGTAGHAGDVAAELTRLGAVQVLTAGAVGDGWTMPDGSRPAVLALPDALPALAGAIGTEQVVDRSIAPADAVPAVIGLVRGGATVLVAAPGSATTEPATPVPATSGGSADGAAAPPAGAAPSSTVPGPIDGFRRASGNLVPRRAVLTFRPADALTHAVLLSDGDVAQVAAVASARAAGAAVEVVPGGDPRSSATVIEAIARIAPSSVLALGPSFGTDDVMAARVATAATGVQLPGGGQTIEPGKRYVALYGTPGTPGLGVLGEQDVPATIARAAEMAAPYRALTAETVVPAVEIIATVASGGPGADGNYSNELPVASLRPLVDAAAAAGDYVVLDLQPGRTDFLTQAQQYAELLALPNVGLALDPEWRLGPDQVHLRQIGSVSVDEVNGVEAWLADFTRERALPQKLFVVHAFSVRMVPGIERLDTSHDELAVLVHVDGQGSQPAKAGTWATLHAAAPQVRWWGWKNFVDEDHPMLDPTQTYQVQPTPDLVTYQ
jgi:hypothetical protein